MTKSLHARLVAVLLGLLLVLGAIFIAISFYSTKRYEEEVVQRLNRALASSLVAEELLMVNGEVHRLWDGLNPTERYGNLLEAWLVRWAALLRSAQRSDSSMDSCATSTLAGYGVHSSNTMTMSEPRSRCTCMDSSGPMNTVSPLTGERKVTPASVILRSSPRLNTWKPPESVRMGPSQFMKSCRVPCCLMIPTPGRSIRWKVLPRMIAAPLCATSSGVMALTVP